MKSLPIKFVILSCLLAGQPAHAAFCGADGFLHGWIGPSRVPCVPHGNPPSIHGIAPGPIRGQFPDALIRK